MQEVVTREMNSEALKSVVNGLGSTLELLKSKNISYQTAGVMVSGYKHVIQAFALDKALERRINGITDRM